MGQLGDILKTLLGHNEDYDEDYGTAIGQDEKLSDCLACERAVVDEQLAHGRLLIKTSEYLRNKYGDQCVDRTIQRLYKRKQRGRCEVSRKRKEDEQTLENAIRIFSPVKKDPFEDQTV